MFEKKKQNIEQVDVKGLFLLKLNRKLVFNYLYIRKYTNFK